MGKLLIAIAFLFMMGNQAISQNVMELELDDRIEDDKISKSLAILPVYKYEDVNIEPYTMFGVSEKPEQEDIVLKKLPDMEGCVDTGYTYIFFSGANTELNQGYLITLIGNYRRSMRTVYFYIDRNNNLDLSDDGPPDSLTYKETEKLLRLQNLTNRAAEHFVKISRIEYGHNVAYKRMLTEHYKKHSGRKVFTNINYCYREQRYNTLAGTYRSGTDSFTIALKDMNNNGLFNESCIDKFYVGSANDQVQTDVMSLILPNTEDIFFEWNKKRYQLRSIKPDGSSVSFAQAEEAELSKKLRIGKKLPKFSFVNLQNERISIKEYKKKPTYIFFWDLENISDTDTAYLGKIHREFGDRISIITLNHGDEPKKVRMMHYYDEIQWPMAFSSTAIGRAFYVESLPAGCLTRKRLKLEKYPITPKQVYEQLSSGEK